MSVPPWMVILIAVIMVAVVVGAFAVDYRDRHPKV